MGEQILSHEDILSDLGLTEFAESGECGSSAVRRLARRCADAERLLEHKVWCLDHVFRLASGDEPNGNEPDDIVSTVVAISMLRSELKSWMNSSVTSRSRGLRQGLSDAWHYLKHKAEVVTFSDEHPDDDGRATLDAAADAISAMMEEVTHG